MKYFDYLRLALKNLSRQKSRTVLTIIAITVGSLSLILMTSLVIGIRQSLIDQFKNLGAFNLVTVIKDPNSVDSNNLMGTGGDTSEGKMINDTTLTEVEKINHVAAATPIISVNIGTVRLAGQDKKTWPNVVAFDPRSDVFTVPIIAGRNLTTSDMDKVVVGSRFLDDFGYGGKANDLIGKKVILNSKMGGGGSGVDWGPPPEKPPANADDSWYKAQGNKGVDIEAEIVGVADNGTVGDGSSYINIAWARRLNTQVSWQQDKNQPKTGDQNSYYQPTMTLVKNDNFLDQGYSSIILKVDDTANLQSVASAVSKLGYGAMTAQSMIDQINKILTMVGVVLGVIAGISLFVAAIGIINTMIMATYERTKEIGVMRACGATKSNIRRLFTFEAALLGFWGGVFGLLISFILGLLAKTLVQKYGASLGNLPINNIGNFPWWLIVGVIAFTTFVGMISGLYPAIRAAKLNPVDALRYE
ncbi:MAG: ABC transporter permease [Candidatus Berkelbacteria bacterium]|nr:ABC transporter permease [Candidatus Berkelbacteria bacterium]